MNKPITKPSSKKALEAATTMKSMIQREFFRQEAIARNLPERTSESIALANKPITKVGGGHTTEMVFESSFGNMGRPASKDLPSVKEVISKQKPKPRSGPGEETAMEAYWGSHGDKQTTEFFATTSTSVMEVVIGEDERDQVLNTEAYPWRCICSLRITAADGTSFIGTGWLVSPRVILTAGHCVYMHNYGGWADTIEVIPGRNGTDEPFGSATCTSMSSVGGWVNDQDSNSDYGVIYLPEDKRYGDDLGTIGFKSYPDTQLEDVRVNISGYPGDKPSGTQWFMAQELSAISDQKLTYMVDTYGGQSGAPVWISRPDGSRHGVGIHVNGSISGNSATRINEDVFNNILYWIGQAP